MGWDERILWMLVVGLLLFFAASCGGVHNAFSEPAEGLEASAQPCPAPKLSMDAWKEYRVPINEGMFTILLPRGWKQYPSTPGLYPRGMDHDGPYWSTSWVRGKYDYFHQWIQPINIPAMRGRTAREDLTVSEYVSCNEKISGREATIETEALLSSLPSVPYQFRVWYCAAATIEVRPSLWLCVSGCLRSKKGQEELLAALRTMDLKEQ